MTSIFPISVDWLAWLCIPCDLLLCERNESRAFINTEMIVQWWIQGTGVGGPVPPLFLDLAEKIFWETPPPPPLHTYIHTCFIYLESYTIK